MTFSEFLNSLKPVLQMFYDSFITLADVLIHNYFFLILIGFILFLSVIDLVFYLLNNFSSNVIFSIDEYVDRKADIEEFARSQAEKELIMRQNYEYNLEKFIRNSAEKELVMRQDYEYNMAKNIRKDAEKELVMRQDYEYTKSKNIRKDAEKELIMRQNRDSLNKKLDKQGYVIPQLPWWFDKEIESSPASPEEQAEMDSLLSDFHDDDY